MDESDKYPSLLCRRIILHLIRKKSFKIQAQG
jgi:hypothetical protein